MKKKNMSKKALAVLLSVIMIATSIPFAIIGTAAGTYDPAPYFSEDAIKAGADAWVDDEGNVQVSFPAATPVPTYKGEATTIAFYILELVDMGSNNAAHTKVVLDTIKSTGTSATFKAADIGTIDLESKRYSVTITAVDTENWFSQPIYSTVSNVPKASINADDFHEFNASDTAVREIMTYESGDDDDGAVTQGSQLVYMGVVQEAGTVDLSDNVSDTSALRFIMHSQPTGTQAFDTSYSRQTWNFAGATEMWCWLDCSDVELTGLAFRLRTNEKLFVEWKDGTVETSQRAGETVYSTKGTAASTYTGENPYVYVQRTDGGWNKVMLKADGTLDIGNFKGYVRVPLKFICSETDTYVDISNQEFGQKKSFTSGINNTVNESNAFSWMAGMTFSQKVTVDSAGTPISDALLIHRRAYKTSSGFLNAGTKHTFTWNLNGQTHYTENVSSYDYSKIGYMLGMPLDEDMAKTSVTTGNASTDRAYVSGTTVMNREGGLKAIEDIYNAGFSVEGCSTDSLSHSFYLDNIFFYRENDDTDGDGVADVTGYSGEVLIGESTNGNSITEYYSEELAVSEIIFDEIDKYISDPDWSDYREISYILDLIEAYRVTFAAKGKSTDFLDLSKNDADDGKEGVGLAWAAGELNRDSWAKAWKAYELCLAAGTLDSANADKYDLVPIMVQTMEKLPEPENIATVSDALKTEILKIWKAYSLLNLGQIEMLGEKEEQEVLAYIALIQDNIGGDFDEFVVGTSLSNKPFILFDDFENYELGTKSYQLEDAPDIYYDGETAYTDYRYTKNFVTYVPDTFEDFAGKSKDTDNSITAFLWGKQPTKDGFEGNLKANAAKGQITDSGFQGTKGATVTVDSNFYTSGEGLYNVVSTTYKGAEAANIDALRATGTGNSSVLLGNMAAELSGSIDPWLSLVFYVDFTELTDFNLSATIQTYFDDTLNDFQIAMGTSASDQNFFILDATSGEWVQANNAEDAGRMFAYTSKAGADTNGDGTFDITLAGYKGYIRIPLYHFKPGNNSQKLDQSALALNNIYRISIGVAPGSQAGADEMYGKSFTIDNIGFSYDPDVYSSQAATREAAGVTDVYFDEFFGAKALPAKEFEDFVDSIDLYSTKFSGDVSVARTKYNALTDYQKTVVSDAEALLQEYELYANGTKEIPKAVYTPSDIATLVNSLPDAIKNAQVSGTYTDENGIVQSYDITYPGFENGAVNYASMGIDKATAEQIVEYYNNGYSRFSNEQKTSIMDQTVRTQFLAAYNMAMRLTSTLEDIRTDSLTFLPEITALYTMKYDYNDDGVLDDVDESVTDGDSYKVGNFISIAGRDDVQSFKTEKYDKLQYYSKTSIDDGSIYPQLTNTSRGFTYFLNNTRSFAVDGEEINGGIITFRDKMQDIYDMANDHITNKTLFTDAELQSVRDIIEEYNAMLPAYYNVEELYELEQAIIRLFPAYQTSMGEQTLMLSAENLSKSTVYTIEYSEYLDITDPYTDTFYVKVVSQNGAMTNDYGDNVSYNVTLKSNDSNSYTVGASDLAGLAEANWAASYPVTNNSSTPSGTQEKFTLTAGVSAAQTGLHGMVTDILTIQLCHPDGTVLEEQTVQVFYSMGDAYTVTIPAEFPVSWSDSDPQDVSYTANTEMNAVSSIKVKVTNDGTGELTNTVTEDVLAYTTENFGVETTFSGMVTDGKQDPAPAVTVSGWDDVPVGEYRTTLTYTVVYDDGDSTT